MAQVGRYEVIRTLAEGGMGSVTLARAPDGDLVVLKRPHESDEDSRQRLRDEARIGTRLLHRSIVDTLDLFEDDEGPVLVVAFVDGVSLEQLRGFGPMPPELVARVGRQMAEALDVLHNVTDEGDKPLNILHRDVSPGNIVVDKTGDAILIDLGIARFDERMADKTQDGFLRGTMRYLAPELIKGEAYSTASDLWSLGMVLWESALGHFAYPGATDREIVANILDGRPMDDVGRHVADVLRSAIEPLLRADPSQRIVSAAEAARHLASVEEGFEDATAATVATISRVTGDHPRIGSDDPAQATESLSIKNAPGHPVDGAGNPSPEIHDELPPGAEDIFEDEPTLAASRMDLPFVDIPRPVSFVGAHPFPELMDPKPENAAPGPARPVAAGGPSPISVSVSSPLMDETIDVANPAALADDEGLATLDHLAAAVVSMTQETVNPAAPDGEPPPTEDEFTPNATDLYDFGAGTQEVSEIDILGPPSDSSERSPFDTQTISSVVNENQDEFMSVDLGAEVDILDEIRAENEPTRLIEGLPPEAPGEPIDAPTIVQSMDELRPPPASPLLQKGAFVDATMEMEVDLESLALEEAQPAEPEPSLEPDLEPEPEPAPEPMASNFEVAAGPGTKEMPRLGRRRTRASTSYSSVSPRRSMGVQHIDVGDAVAVARIGLKRVGVDQDGNRVEVSSPSPAVPPPSPPSPARASPPSSPAFGVQRVPRITDSDAADPTRVADAPLGLSSLREPDALADPFVRRAFTPGPAAPPLANPFLTDVVEPLEHKEITHTEAKRLAAVDMDFDDDDDDDEPGNLSLDDVLDIMDD